MPTKPCPDCGREVSTIAQSCPQCGRPLKPSPGPFPTKEGPFLQTLNIGCILVLGIFGLGCLILLLAFLAQPTR
jgi:hypothetical protein